MKSALLMLVAVALTCLSLFGQAVTQASQPHTFHVQGLVSDALGAVVPNVKVTFQGGQSAKTVVTNDMGRYEADLPLGDYSMSAQASTPGFKAYRRPPFRVSTPSNLTFEVRLQICRCGDMVIVNSSGRAPTDAEIYTATANCRHEDLFPQPHLRNELQLSIQYETRAEATQVVTYTGASHEDPVAVAYNLFSLHADHVVYDAKQKTLEARGNVVVEDESGKRSADAMSFRVEDGRAIQR